MKFAPLPCPLTRRSGLSSRFWVVGMSPVQSRIQSSNSVPLTTPMQLQKMKKYCDGVHRKGRILPSVRILLYHEFLLLRRTAGWIQENNEIIKQQEARPYSLNS